MKNLNHLLVLAAIACLASCGAKDALVQYYPYQEKEDGRWGLVSPEGKVLFSEEFKQQPTVAMNDRFLVQNSDWKWEIYTADAKPVQVGEKYATACPFRSDVAPVAREGKAIELIDREGKVVADLAKLDGKKVTGVYNYVDDYAIFENENGDCGVIDTKGNVVIPAKYAALSMGNDGVLLGVDSKDRETLYSEGTIGVNVHVLNVKGEELFTLKKGKYTECAPYSNGVLPVCVDKGGDKAWGFMDKKGEYKLEPSTKVEGLSGWTENNFVFESDNAYGIMNYKGEVLVRAKYSRLLPLNKQGTAFVAKKDWRDDYVLINGEGERIGNEEFEDYVQDWNGRDVVYVKTGKHSWQVLSVKDGTFVKDAYEVANVENNFGPQYVQSELPTVEPDDETPVEAVDDEWEGADTIEVDSVAVEEMW